MKYRSLSLTGFEAVQIDLEKLEPVKSHRWKREKPEWFQTMMDKGDIAPVVNSKEQYVTLRNKNATFKCYNGDYIVKNRVGLTFWMPRELFEESFTIDTGRVGLTQKQQEVYDYLLTCENPPSVREIMIAVGYKTPSNVKRILDALKERGYINFKPYRARSIVVL